MVVSAALGASLLSAIEGTGAAASAPAPMAGSGALPQGPAQDVPSALLAARLGKERVEVLDMRSETSTTWADPRGTLTTEVGLGPVRVKKGTGWVPVDPTLVRGADGGVRPRASTADIAFSGGGTPPSPRTAAPMGPLGGDPAAPRQRLASVGDEGKAVALGWKGALPVPVLSGTKATYREVRPGIDLVLESMPTGIEYFVVVKNHRAADAARTIELPVDAQGLTPRKAASGGLEFTDAAGKVRGRMPAAVMWDAAVDPITKEHRRRAPVDMRWRQRGDSGLTVTLTPDRKLLRDPKATFPITIDPVIEWGLSFDTFVQQGTEWNKDNSDDRDLKIGNNGLGQIARTFMFFRLPTDLWGKHIRNARVFMNNYHSATCVPQPWEMYVSGVPDRTSRWSNQPALYGLAAAGTMTKDKDTDDAHQCDSDNAWISADVTGTLQGVLDQRWTTLSLGMKAGNEATVDGWKRFHSGNTNAYPKMNIVWNSYPDVSDLRVAPVGTVGNGQPGNPAYTSSPRPTASFTVNDADGGLVQSIVEVRDDQGTIKRFVLGYVPAGSRQHWQVPEGLLKEGRGYGIRVNVADGTTWARGWTAWFDGITDTAPPSAPGVTSTDYPKGKWVKGAGQTGAFTLTPPAGEQIALEWSLDGAVWTRVATGGTTAPVTARVTPPTAGTHTLQVRSVDRAENTSEAAAYRFHAGAGGITSLTGGQRTAARLPLAAEGDASRYTAVAFSWRRSDADAWAPVPPAHVTQGGQPLAAWPVALSDGTSPRLAWNATTTVDPGGPVQIRADFTGPGAAASSDVLRAVVDRTADGATSTSVGPGSLNLLTGAYRLGGVDATAFGVSVSRTATSRLPDAHGQLEGQAAIFGREWVSGVLAEQTNPLYTAVRRTSDTSVDVDTKDGTTIGFTANAAGNGWIPEPGAENLTLTGSLTGGFTLATDDGDIVTFAKADPGAAAWTVSTSLAGGLEHSTTKVVSESVAEGGRTLVRPKRIIAASSAVTAATCELDPARRGCRVLEFDYAPATTATGQALGDVAGQVRALRLWATAPGATASTPVGIARYLYDERGRLREVWDPRVSPALKTAYAYDGAGRVTQLGPAGELPWTFRYGTAGGSAAAGEGMLLSVSRPTLTPGSATETNGTATTSVVYGVPLTGSGAPYDLGAQAVTAWGQRETATDATAVFPADQIPDGGDGSRLPADAYGRATVTYLDASGRSVNTAQPGGHISTTEYHASGRTARELTAANRALALGTGPGAHATLTALGISALSTAERARQLSTQHTYDADGTRELETLGPLRTVALTHHLVDGATTIATAGARVPARARTVLEYDAGRPTDGSAVLSDAVTRTTTGAQPRSHPALLADRRVTATAYDWAKGLATSTTQDPGGLALTKTTSYDAAGQVTRTTLPASNGSDAGATVTAYYSGGGSGPCGGRPEWAGEICATGPAGTIAGGGPNPDQLVSKTFEYGLLGQITKTAESANGVTRTTVREHDASGRDTAVSVTGGIGAPVPTVTTAYSPETGRTIATTTGSDSITRVFDRLGRQISYRDADGATTTTRYDQLDRPTTVTDSAPSTTSYTYDTAIDPRGTATSVADSDAGTFTVRRDADGGLLVQGLPGGHTMRQSLDPTGVPVTRTYTRDADGVPLSADAVAPTVHGEWGDRALTTGRSVSQTYAYDQVGRLTRATDTVADVCVTRAYGYDRNSNRVSRSTATAQTGELCETATPTTSHHTYDSADRLTDPGHTYDAFGRTLAQPGGVSTGYYADDRVQTQAKGAHRQTWTLDPGMRPRAWTTEGGQGGSGLHHYGDDTDNPRWTVENTASGAVLRNIIAPSGELGALTTGPGSTALTLADLHGDITVTLPLGGTATPEVREYDEFGTTTAGPATRYGWHGARLRSAGTPTGQLLMGVRLYQPATGRFLQTDPVLYGSANAYDYADQNPVTNLDPTGLWRVRYVRNYTNLGVRFDRRITQAVAWGGSAVWLASFLAPVWGRLIRATISSAVGNAWYALYRERCLYVNLYYYPRYPKWGNTPCF
ncbi:RHS repeat-associated core domain-containing protein [Streptomyces sp. NPDC057638]|uniref:RHS repeat-associated core domain-containing protein n=1 Tax=Streptomyces sp. NPDC057638 TaxID=3346190 RepID=UPI0036CE4750